MDTLHTVLAPYSNNLMSVAATVTVLQFLSGIFLVIDIYKQRSSLNTPAGPFLGGIVLSLLTLKYGMLLRDDGMIKVNFFGLALNIIYMCSYYLYTPNDHKMRVWKEIGIAGLISTLILIYAEYEDPKLIEFRIGLLITLILICLVGMPFLSFKDIIRKQSTEGLPFPIIFSGFIVSLSWLLYGISIGNSVLAIQNLILCTMGFIQLSLFVIYPSSTTNTKKRKNE